MDKLAIVGVKLRVPGADSPDSLWANLVAGRSSITPVSASDDPARGQPGYVAWAGAIAGIEDFDYGAFGYSFREAQHIDPQQRILLTLAHELCEDIGPPTRDIGVFVSVGFPSYLVHNLIPAGADAGLSSLGTSSHAAATRIAYKLDLGGPAFAVDCGCSSSLVALHMARVSILTGQCEMALVGGCSLQIPSERGYVHQRDGVLAQDGRCRPFDADATGTVFTSGAVIVAVKKLSTALDHGDDIWSVITGTAANNDGSRKAGFTAPSVVGQRQLIERIYTRARISPEQVGYLEAHGTGTALGDPIEVQALSEAFAGFTRARGFCSLGSIKANVGHLDVAAGILGVVKASLCLRQRETPPLANFTRINPRIELAPSPFYIQTEARSWDVEGAAPRRAAVSSLGVGGTNAHALLEQAPPRRAGSSSRWGLVVCSAASRDALTAKLDALTATATATPERVGDLAYTSQLGHPRHAARVATVVNVGAEDQLIEPSGDWRRCPLVFAFPGQGTQYPGMGRELHAHVPEFSDAFERTAELFRQAGASDPLALLDADAATLARTEVLQPYLFTVEYALGRTLLEFGLQPTAMLGHSLGEYVAATLAGVFDLELAVRVVAERTRLMAAAPGGAMLVVHVSADRARELLDEGVWLCTINGAHSSVVGGTVAAIEAFAAKLERVGERSLRLETSHAFHSPLMAEAATKLERAFAGATLRPPRIPIVSNLDGRQDDPARFTRTEYWAEHMRAPVRLFDGLKTIMGAAPPVVLELGPGRSIASNLLASFAGARVLSAVAANAERHRLFGLVGQLWLNGVALDRRAFVQGRRGRITATPRPDLAPRRCWIDASAATPAPIPGTAALCKRERIADWLYEPRWSPRAASESPPDQAGGRELTMFSTSRAAAVTLTAALERAGARVQSVDIADLCANGPRELAELEDALLERLGPRTLGRAVVVFADNRDAPDSSAEVVVAILVALAIAKLARAAARERAELILVGVQGLRITTEPLHWWNGWIDGFATVASQEASLRTRSIDVDARALVDAEPLAAAILDGDERVLAIRDGLIWDRELRPLRPRSAQPGPSTQPGPSHALILGGAGNVGLVHALHFVRAGASKVAIVSRDAASVGAQLEAGEQPAGRIWARRRALVEEAERAGVELVFADADARSTATLERVVDGIVRRFGGLDTIVQASGAPAALHFRPLFKTDAAQLEALIGAKLEVARGVERVARRHGVAQVLVVSSISAVLGGLGMLGYSTSHNLLDAYAAATGDRRCRWASVAWDAWEFYKDERVEADAIGLGLDALAITEREGLEVLDALAAQAWPSHVIVASGDLQRRYASWVLRSEGRARAELGERPNLREEYLAPNSMIERRLAALWSETIGVAPVGVHDSFFELGGDSLLALTLVDHINRALDQDISVMEVFKYPTVAKLGAWLGARLAEPRTPTPSSPDTRARGRRRYMTAMKQRRGSDHDND